MNTCISKVLVRRRFNISQVIDHGLLLLANANNYVLNHPKIWNVYVWLCKYYCWEYCRSDSSSTTTTNDLEEDIIVYENSKFKLLSMVDLENICGIPALGQDVNGNLISVTSLHGKYATANVLVMNTISMDAQLMEHDEVYNWIEDERKVAMDYIPAYPLYMQTNTGEVSYDK